MRGKVIKISICVFGFLCVIGIYKAATGSKSTPSSSSVMKEWGASLREYTKKEYHDENVYARGNRATVLWSDVEQAATFYRLSGTDQEKAEEKAKEYMMQREALYQEALSQGYDVTDQEIYDYLDELKAFMASASNKEDAYALIQGFGSEEDYWDYQFTVYKKDLPIQNMVNDLKKQYEESLNVPGSHNIQEWNDYFESYKKTLVDQENFQMNSPVSATDTKNK